ncbi:MAG: glutathione S-transferase N-terminal domain-containing protein [Mitsuaria chitosanitabida]|uniref:glutathione binding-like protein n=1 Tax=Roseateles chitosanitabidus TaxID=65048 RepID=UPI001B269593|nr:glutathione binding-like protein [Roseateles chitosanitabidus]MBO9687054.1 glutathione S-transferase N-terminal domain-containing protein [Roseateles chitosanitabidus]
MKLYYFPGACSLAGHIVLEWIARPYETVRMSLESIKTPDYLAINPGGTVPLLKHDDFLLTENVAILGYLGDLNPEAGLLGDGSAKGRADVMRWLAFLNSDVHKAFKPIFVPGRFLDDAAAAGPLAEKARGHVRHYLERLDAQLRDREWLTGERSVADPYLFVLLRWAKAKGVDFSDLSHLMAFRERMYGDPAVQRALTAEEGHASAGAPA